MTSNKLSEGNSKMKEMNLMQSRENVGLPFTITAACCTKYIQINPLGRYFWKKCKNWAY
jgi:hypothetical protein